MKPLFILGCLVACASLTAALAVDLPDPTRPPYGSGNQPPQGWRSQGNAAAGVDESASDAASRSVGASPARGKGGNPAARTVRLSAVMLADAPGRHVAVIDGEVFHVGDKVRGAVVAAIGAAGVTLREAGGHSVLLKLYDRPPEQVDGTDAQPVARKPAAAAPSAAEAASLPLSSPSGAAAPGKDQP